MFRILLLLFIFVPLLEIYLLIQVGGVIGAVPTIVLILLTAVIGVVLLRQQGFTTLARVQDKLDRGRIPAVDLTAGLLLLLAGALLLTPGFATDSLGFLLLLPRLRTYVAEHLLQEVLRQHAARADAGTVIIEAEYWDEEQKKLH
ncbi:MAG: FxsA family protein [bacterium]